MTNRTKHLLGVAAVAAMTCTTALGTDLSVSVLSGGSGTVNVTVGANVAYEVEGALNGGVEDNGGLALVLFDLSLDGAGCSGSSCDLSQANTPATDPMASFVKNEGITNPAGYGGTVIGGDLIQICGSQNTIKNPGAPDYPEFPVGEVLTGVAWPTSPATLVTGSLTAPDTPGTYTLSLTNLAASVIAQGEDGSGVFWATQLVTGTVLADLTIVVLPAECVLNEECDDGDACTADTCDPGDPEADLIGCVFEAITCDDFEACTDDSCDVVTGCVYQYRQAFFADIVAPFAADPSPPTQPDVDDIMCVLDGYAAGGAWADVCPDGDLVDSGSACAPDDAIGLEDVMAALDAFGHGAPCEDPCP